MPLRNKPDFEKKRSLKVPLIATIIVFAGLGIYFLTNSSAAPTTGTGGAKTDQTNVSFSANGITSKYHIYAAGLDWSKQVGMIIYADGSGEYGLKNPTNSYLLGGNNGLVAVAKRNNMLLLTPLAPGGGCSDGDGSCWYLPSGSINAPQKLQWAEALVKHVQSQYPIELNRVAMGGYSSGAQLAAQYWVPSGAAQRTMTDGVIVSISCGGAPMNSEDPISSEVAYTASFKSSVHMNWNSGDNDNGCPHTANWSTNGGYNHFTGKGFQTSRDLLPGVTHDRSGDFGSIMEAQIKEHVPPAGATTNPPGPTPTPPVPPTNPPSPPTTPPSTPPSQTPGRRSDINGDGRVNLTDLSILLSDWGWRSN